MSNPENIARDMVADALRELVREGDSNPQETLLLRLQMSINNSADIVARDRAALIERGWTEPNKGER
jgi:hypothetical protein